MFAPWFVIFVEWLSPETVTTAFSLFRYVNSGVRMWSLFFESSQWESKLTGGILLLSEVPYHFDSFTFVVC